MLQSVAYRPTVYRTRMGVLCLEMAHQNKDDFFLPKGFHVPLIIYFFVREAVLMTEHFLSDFAEFLI